MKDTQFNLCHVKPTAMLGCVVYFQLFNDTPRFGRREGLIKRSKFMCIQIVHDEYNLLRLGEMDINQIAHTVGEINHRAPVGDFDMPPCFQGSEKEKQITRPIPFILIIILGQIPGLGGNGKRVSFVCCLPPSSKQTKGRFGSCGRWYTSSTSSMAQTNSALSFSGMHHSSFNQGLSSFFLRLCAPSHTKRFPLLPIQ